MSIGLIIFIVSIAISLISALNDKSHKKRQQNQPKSSQPRKQPTAERRNKTFWEQVGDKFEEIQNELEGNTNTKPTEKHKPLNESSDTSRKSKNKSTSARENKRINQSQKEVQTAQALNQSILDQLNSYQSQMDLEKQKQLEILERRAQEIINDKYLSERAKRTRIKQLFDSKLEGISPQNDELRFNDNDVINGIIWSEILSKPKQLR